MASVGAPASRAALIERSFTPRNASHELHRTPHTAPPPVAVPTSRLCVRPLVQQSVNDELVEGDASGAVNILRGDPGVRTSHAPHAPQQSTLAASPSSPSDSQCGWLRFAVRCGVVSARGRMVAWRAIRRSAAEEALAPFVLFHHQPVHRPRSPCCCLCQRTLSLPPGDGCGDAWDVVDGEGAQDVRTVHGVVGCGASGRRGGVVGAVWASVAPHVHLMSRSRKFIGWEQAPLRPADLAAEREIERGRE